MPDKYFFRVPFALEGDQQLIPEALQPTGAVSFQTGYGFDYERDPSSDPNAKDIERGKTNWLFWAITTVLRHYQTYGAFPYILPEQNKGTAFPYEKGARCAYGEENSVSVYESLVNNNTALPTDPAKWMRVSVADLVPKSRRINVSGGLTGGGELSRDVTIGVTIPASVPPTRTITTTAPLTGGGDLSANRTLGLNAASAPTANYVVQRDAAGRAQVAAPVVDADIARKADVDAVKKLIPSVYELGEFYYFRHPTLRLGFQPAQGGVIIGADKKYPEIWAYLQTTEGKKLCKTEAEWQALVNFVWHTNADGSKVGFNGIGGAPWFVQDLAAKTLRMPDVRGMYAEAAGIDSLGVGGVHGWGAPRITGSVNRNSVVQITDLTNDTSGAFYQTSTEGTYRIAGQVGASRGLGYDSGRVMPVAAKVQGAAWGSLACVYLGIPAS